MLDRKTQSLIDALYESHVPTNTTKVLLDTKKWSHVISLQEIRALNKAYEKFLFAEPMIMLESRIQDRSKLWEQFLKLEDELIFEAPKEDDAPAGEDKSDKKQGFLSRAWGKVKGAGKAALRGAAGKASLSRYGKSGRDREAEFQEMISSTENAIGDLIKAMNAAVGNFEEYPNMKSNQEFQKMTAAALTAADAKISQLEDNAQKAAMIEATKKWISYVLDQKLGDFYKHFQESSLALGELLAEEEKKKGGLATKSGESETLKGLKSNVAPAILGALGAAGLAAAGILKAYPDLLGSDSVEVLSQGDPTQVEELVTQKLGPVKITDWSAKGSADQVYQHIFGNKPGSSEDYVKLFKTFDPEGGDPTKGAQNFFDAAGIRNANGKTLNSDYVLGRLSKMNPKEAFNMPGVGQMERFGGRAGIPKMVTNIVVKQLTKKAVAGPITKVLASAGISTAGAAAMGAAATLAAGGILSAIAVKLLRNKSLKDSRAAWLDALIDNFGKVKEKKENQADPDAQEIEVQIDVEAGQANVSAGGSKDGGNQGGTGGDQQDQSGGPEEEGEEEDEKKGCDDDTLRQKLTATLATVRFKKGGDAAVEKMIKAVSDKQPKDLEDLKNILNSNRKNKLRDSTVTAFAKSIADCVGVNVSESKRKNDAVLLERWQKMAGV